ncbi:hypothetical protein [Fimbriimonas ginsengisoli]|nr:hypothetical protein [Fimbriimonas ginsengisoli]
MTSGLTMSVSGGGGYSVTPGHGAISGGAGGGGGSASASGLISTTFTWQRGTIYGGELDPDDNPPDTVVVIETCNASAGASAYGGASGSSAANNGLGTTTVNLTTPIYQPVPFPPFQIQIGTNYSSVCNGSKATIKPGGDTVTVNQCSVSGSASSGSGPFNVGVTYGVSCDAVNLFVNGTVKDHGTQYGEVGRLDSGTLSAPGVILSQWQWNVGGSDAFKTYRHDTIGLVTYLTSADLAVESPSWHWKKGKAETVSVTANASYNGVSIGSIYQSKTVNVEAPTPVWSGITPSGLSNEVHYGLVSNGNPTCLSPITGSPVGMYYSFGGTKCPHFPDGTLFCAQLVNAYWYFDGILIDQWSTTSGRYDLDSSYPYNNSGPTYDPAVYRYPIREDDQDTPGYWKIQVGAVQVLTNFQTNLMYRSSDTSEQDIALYSQSWDWNGSSTSSPPPASPTAGGGGALSSHPTWTNIFVP